MDSLEGPSQLSHWHINAINYFLAWQTSSSKAHDWTTARMSAGHLFLKTYLNLVSNQKCFFFFLKWSGMFGTFHELKTRYHGKFLYSDQAPD